MRRGYARVFATLTCSLCLGIQVATGATVTVNTGVYEITTETLLPNLEQGLRYATTVSKKCLGKQEAANYFPVLREVSFVGCKLIDAKISAESSGYALICRNSNAATGSAQFSISATAFRAVLKVKMGGKNMRFSQRVRGQRQGDCDPANRVEQR